MNYSDQQLQTIESLASVFLPIPDIAQVIEVPAHELREDIRDTTHPASISYRRGKLATKINIYRQETKLASIGSPLAIDNTRRHLADMEDDE